MPYGFTYFAWNRLPSLAKARIIVRAKHIAKANKRLRAKINRPPMPTKIKFTLNIKPHKIDPPLKASWERALIAKFDDAEIKFVPWFHKNWNIAGKLKHYPHVDKTGTKIRYHKSPKDGKAQLYTLIKPGRYLKKYYNDILSPAQLTYWEKRFLYDNEIPVCSITNDPFTIQRVYANGPRSCMNNETKFNSHVHPASAYGSKDLAIAYLEKLSIPNNFSARAVVNTERKIYGRLYGDEMRLAKALEGLGYAPSKVSGPYGSSTYNGALIGAHLLKIKNDYTHHWLVPYIDAVEFGINEIEGDDKYLQIVDKRDATVPPDVRARGGQPMAERGSNCLHHYFKKYCEECQLGFNALYKQSIRTGPNQVPIDVCSECTAKNKDRIQNCQYCNRPIIGENARDILIKKNTIAISESPKMEEDLIHKTTILSIHSTIGPFCTPCLKSRTFRCWKCDLTFSKAHGEGSYRVREEESEWWEPRECYMCHFRGSKYAGMVYWSREMYPRNLDIPWLKVVKKDAEMVDFEEDGGYPIPEVPQPVDPGEVHFVNAGIGAAPVEGEVVHINANGQVLRRVGANIAFNAPPVRAVRIEGFND